MQVARDPVERGATHIGRVVIVEGVDDESPLTLKEIFEQKIRHVQGYITRTPAGPRLSTVPEEIRRDIAAQVRGDDGEQPTSLDSLRRGA
jgi:hypothetical protein